jgi:hypothetical protein
MIHKLARMILPSFMSLPERRLLSREVMIHVRSEVFDVPASAAQTLIAL